MVQHWCLRLKTGLWVNSHSKASSATIQKWLYFMFSHHSGLTRSAFHSSTSEITGAISHFSIFSSCNIILHFPTRGRWWLDLRAHHSNRMPNTNQKPQTKNRLYQIHISTSVRMKTWEQRENRRVCLWLLRTQRPPQRTPSSNTFHTDRLVFCNVILLYVAGSSWSKDDVFVLQFQENTDLSRTNVMPFGNLEQFHVCNH